MKQILILWIRTLLFFSVLLNFGIWRCIRKDKRMYNDTLNVRKAAALMDKENGVITEGEYEQKIKTLIKYGNSLKTAEYICVIVTGLPVIVIMYMCFIN